MDNGKNPLKILPNNPAALFLANAFRLRGEYLLSLSRFQASANQSRKWKINPAYGRAGLMGRHGLFNKIGNLLDENRFWHMPNSMGWAR